MADIGDPGSGVKSQLASDDALRSASKDFIRPDDDDETMQGRRLPPQETTDKDASATGSHHESSRRKVVTGLPRSQTFKRRLSEQRTHLEPAPRAPEERRAASVDRRGLQTKTDGHESDTDAHSSTVAPLSSSFFGDVGFRSTPDLVGQNDNYKLSGSNFEPKSLNHSLRLEDEAKVESFPSVDNVSVSVSQHEAMIADELDKKWILNLSMHFRDRTKREKFFVTYRENQRTWRRVTISLDYRNAPPNSLEMDLLHSRSQREKITKIYEAIRESLHDIQFYDTATNLKLETTDHRLHVHVVEDGNEIIQFPKMSQISHLDCRRVRESDITFNSHMSGFVYNVTVKGRTLIKKEIPGPETIDEFLYEVNALATLHSSNSVVRLYGVVVDDYGDEVKGLLIEYAEQGALNDILYDNCREQNDGILWSKRQKWALQIVQGLADIHESGFVQGDFTMSNIVVTAKGNAKIIDINRRGCPLGWEPPEATALIKTHHRMTLYIGVKSDLYQLGMVLWGLAMLDDEPECHGRPLVLGPEVQVPDWYRQVTEICLSADPRMRLQASTLLHMFPPDDTQDSSPDDDTWSIGGYSVDDFTHRQPYIIRTVEPSDRWESTGRAYIDPGSEFDGEIFPMRGRSPPSPLTSDGDEAALPNRYLSSTSWAANNSVRPSFSDVAEDDATLEDSEAEVASEAKVSFNPEKQEVTSAILPEADTATQEYRPEQAAALAANRRRSLGDGLQIFSTPKLSRKPTAIRDPPPGASSHGESESEKFGTSEGGLPADAVTTRIGDTQDTRTTESEGEGGVSLQLNDEAMDHNETMTRNRTAELTRLIKLPDDTKGRTFNSDCVRPVVDELSPNPRSMAQDYTKGAMSPRTAGSMLDDYALLDARLSETFDTNENRKHARRTGTFERQLSLPLSLAGIGAGLHSGRDAGIGDETDADADYYALTRPATMPAMTFTTDT